jgi:DNA repair exonuclease SbcCD ATPase subunit
MTDFAPAELPLAIDRVHGSRASPGEIRLALSGAWHGSGQPAADEPLLVVQVEGRRHRFPADRDDRAAELPPGRWRATFSVPDWAEPRHEGQAAVWIGNAVVPVPPLHGSHHASPALAAAVPAAERMASEGRAVPQVETESDEYRGHPAGESPDFGQTDASVRSADTAPRGAGGAPPPETPRSGPLADLLLKETVAALHTELEHRAGEVARLRGALGDAQAELGARTETQSQLESTLGELSVELKRLMEAVEEQRSELDEHQVRAAQERDQLERRLRELSEAHEQEMAETSTAHERDLAAARHELSELRTVAESRNHELRRALEEAAEAQSRAERGGLETSTLREELAASHVAREAALSELAGLQAEMSRIGAELAVTRERVSSESGDLGQANRLLAEAKALAEQLRRERGG